MNLEKLLTTTDWTNESLGEAVGASHATISRLRTDTRAASLALALRIEIATDGQVTVLECPISDYSRRGWKKWLGWVGI